MYGKDSGNVHLCAEIMSIIAAYVYSKDVQNSSQDNGATLVTHQSSRSTTLRLANKWHVNINPKHIHRGGVAVSS